MISRDGRYWSTGIVLSWTANSGGEVPGWGGKLSFLDDGFVNDDADQGRVSTEGELTTRYHVRDGEIVTGLRAAIDTLIADAEQLGIVWRIGPSLMYAGDGESDRFPPPDGWRDMLAEEAKRLGWETYGVELELASEIHQED